MKSFFAEFKEFINKGNAVSMAIGIIIGSAFTTIVNTIVEQLITPLLGLLCGGIDFSSFGFSVGDAYFGIGKVINAALSFLITAFVLFLVIKAMNGLNGQTQKLAQLLKSDITGDAGESKNKPDPGNNTKDTAETAETAPGESGDEKTAQEGKNQGIESGTSWHGEPGREELLLSEIRDLLKNMRTGDGCSGK